MLHEGFFIVEDEVKCLRIFFIILGFVDYYLKCNLGSKIEIIEKAVICYYDDKFYFFLDDLVA